MLIDEQYIMGPKKLVYTRIAEKDTAAKADLLAQTNLTSSTLTRLLDEMIEEKLIEAAEFGPSRGGRRPILYRTLADYGYIFGLEISRIHSSLGLFDMHLNPRSVVHWRMDEAMTPERFLEYTVGQMRNFLRDHAIPQDKILGVGIGSVGPLDRNTGTVLDPLYFPAKGWHDIPICELFHRETGWLTLLENGTNAALMGEQWALRDQSIQHALYVHAGVSLRSAIMSHGRIVHGTVDMEGSIGQMIIQCDGPRLNASGNYGALEAYASIEALEKEARSLAKMGVFLNHDQQLEIPPEQLRYDTLLQALKAGDPSVREMFSRSAAYFGIGLANLINTLHPEMVILGGSLITSNQMYFEESTKIALKHVHYSSKYKPQFSKGQLKEAAVVTGAALNVWKTIEL
ncbi:ROK family protein [Paenibacillus sp. MDMC362]|uniref:ROK family protein n=1 Tax=Paenibacillus sp. MDMC362 TaxID=2977365 RepID=UPI000DC20F23|nr:ROK family protein [Paenibacillus sp. MDMC362]RAR44692.1 sugar kinase [Paenibacillus sp. MDMC362]